MARDGGLFQIAVTPVYVESLRGQALLNVLVAGYAIDALVAQQFKKSTGGSEFVFLSGGSVIASTLNPRATGELTRRIAAGWKGGRISDGVFEYAPLMKPLIDVEGKPIGELWILRSFESSRQRIAALRRDMVLTWLCAVIAGLWLTYLLARRIVEPVKQLDRAAAEVARQNYDFRLRVESDDELGRLVGAFNAMCDSIQSARSELIRQERISTIGRLSSSIVHDLRNPLAAIYGGAEMLVDTDLSPSQMKRLAANIYRASRRIQELLQDLVNVSRGKSKAAEICHLREVVEAACDVSSAAAESQGVKIILRARRRYRAADRARPHGACIPESDRQRARGHARRRRDPHLRASRGRIGADSICRHRTRHFAFHPGKTLRAICQRRQEERIGSGPGLVPPDRARPRRRDMGRAEHPRRQIHHPPAAQESGAGW